MAFPRLDNQSVDVDKFETISTSSVIKTGRSRKSKKNSAAEGRRVILYFVRVMTFNSIPDRRSPLLNG